MAEETCSVAVLTARLEAQRELFEARITAAERALRLQADEYERRLALLNGEAERLRSIQLNYIPREVYEAAHRELKMTAEAAERKVIALEQSHAATVANVIRLETGLTWISRTVIGSVIAAAIAGMVAIIEMWIRK